MADLKRFFCVRFSRKSGKIDKTLSGLVCGMLQMWALQNTTAKTKDSIVFDEDGWVKVYYEGTGDFPNITKYGENTTEGKVHIDTFCEGLLDALLEEEA